MKQIFLLGDSIRMGSQGTTGYEPFLRQKSLGAWVCHSPQENCQFAQYALRHVHQWAEGCPAGEIDLVIFNCGLWDVLRMFGDDPLTPPEVYDLMRRYRFSIVRSVRLKIDHRLVARPGATLSSIREIVSHEQAIGQCSAFLKTLKDVKITVCENTAMAAQMVSQSGRDDIAAISSPACAGLYGLCVLKSDISDSDSNFTRFICISKNLEIYPGADKVSLMLNVAHRPGALYGMIARFAALGLNLTKLESRPIAGTDFEFMFYFDLDASVYDEAALGLLCELDEGPEAFTYLGSYSEA